MPIIDRTEVIRLITLSLRNEGLDPKGAEEWAEQLIDRYLEDAQKEERTERNGMDER